MFYEILQRDEKLIGNLRKATKLIYFAVHPGKNKQNITLPLAIFHETTTAAMKSCFPDQIDAAE